eukprot:3808659-Karenia_brevis.AAC.1
MCSYRKTTVETQEIFRQRQRDGTWTDADRRESRRISETWDVFMIAANPAHSNAERYMLMLGNSKFWHELRKPP